MARRKVRHAYITKDSARRASFRKRKKGLMKKASELSTLCGVDACVIVYNPDKIEPEVWPDHDGVEQVLTRFEMLPEAEQNKKMMDQESFTKHMVIKAYDRLEKLRKDNRDKEMMYLMNQCLVGRSVQNLPLTDLDDLQWTIRQKLNEIERVLKKKDPHPPQEQEPLMNLTGDATMQMPHLATNWVNNPNEHARSGHA